MKDLILYQSLIFLAFFTITILFYKFLNTKIYRRFSGGYWVKIDTIWMKLEESELNQKDLTKIYPEYEDYTL